MMINKKDVDYDMLLNIDNRLKHIKAELKNHGVIGDVMSFSADDIKEVYEIGRMHEKNGSDCTSEQIKNAWVRADDLYKNLKFE